MLANLFWDIATSAPLLAIYGLLLVAAIVVGWFPLVRFVPFIGPYVPTARLVTFVVAVVMAFMLGARSMDEREATKNLRVEVATKAADFEIAEQSRADAAERADRIEKEANDQKQRDQDYIAQLKSNPACGFDPGEPPARRVRVQPWRGFLDGLGRASARSAGATGKPDESAAAAGP